MWLGLLAGIGAMIPLLALFVPALYVSGLFGFGIPPNTPGYELFLGLVFVFFLSYTVGLSVVGGVVGIWVRENTDRDLDLSRWL